MALNCLFFMFSFFVSQQRLNLKKFLVTFCSSIHHKWNTFCGLFVVSASQCMKFVFVCLSVMSLSLPSFFDTLSNPLLLVTVFLFGCFQLLFGEEHVVILSEDYASEIWPVRLCSTSPNTEHSLRKHSK